MSATRTSMLPENFTQKNIFLPLPQNEKKRNDPQYLFSASLLFFGFCYSHIQCYNFDFFLIPLGFKNFEVKIQTYYFLAFKSGLEKTFRAGFCHIN